MTSTKAAPPPREWRRWAFICAVLVQLMVACISIMLMSALRVVVGGESLWSKGLHEALIHLTAYADKGNPQAFQDFQRALSIPLGVGQARQALDEGGHDVATIQQGLLRGENHPHDVASLSRVLPYVWQLSTLAPTIHLWRRGDFYIQKLDQLGQAFYTQRNGSAALPAQTINQWQQQISQLRQEVVPLTKEFAASLGSNSRALSNLLLLINLCTATVLAALYWVTIQRAMNERALASTKLETERQRSTTTLAALGDGVLTLDAEQRIRYANPAATQLLAIRREDLMGTPVLQILPFAPELIAQHKAKIKDTESINLQPEERVHWLPRAPDADNDVAVRINITYLEEDCEDCGYVLVLHDVSQEQNYMRMLAWQQSHDLLTGLDNRLAFEKCLQQTLGKQPATLLHLNLDHFKMINASYGHAAGDEILRQVCQQLRMVLRESDILARIGGDDFAALLSQCQPHAAMQTAERLRKSIHELNVTWRNHNLHTAVSIGVVHIDPKQRNDSQSLLGMADSACKHAKESGRNRIIVYNPFDRVFHRFQGDMEWVQRLRTSLEEDKFTLFAQTVYPLHPQGKGMGGIHFEVLLRLFDTGEKQLSPAEFIPIAERYDLMTQIDRWVVQKTMRLLKLHLAQGANISTCSINLSGTSLGDSELLEFIRHNILEQGVAAEKLCFEITETSAIASLENAIFMIDELRKLGCRFSLDDFGSGMASFKYLQQLPVDYLKIDGSFVKDMLKKPNNYAMVEAINHMGHVMGKRTVAEFVGDQATYEALKAMGVDYAQGYYIAPPTPLDSNFFLRAALPPPQLAPARTGQPK